MQPALRSIALAALLALACSDPEPGPSASQVVAVIDRDEITLADLDAWIKDDWFEDQVEGKSPAAVHEFRSEHLERMIDESLVEAEAALRGISPEELVHERAASVAVSDAEVAAFFEANRERLGEATQEQLAPRIRRHLEQQKAREAVKTLVTELRERSSVVVDFEAPRVEVAAAGPSLGPESAPVTIVEFSDFQCPYCARAGPIVRQLRERYPDQVRIVYRQFPLESIHARARAAAEASLCASEQERFWEYHDVLFANPRALEDADLERYAGELGLDLDGFRACMAEGRYRDAVQRDLEDGRRAGVSGTPAFFVNGRMLAGAQPLEEFVKIIEAELRRASGAAS